MKRHISENSIRCTFTFPKEEYAEVEAFAKENFLPVAGLMRIAIMRFVRAKGDLFQPLPDNQKRGGFRTPFVDKERG